MGQSKIILVTRPICPPWDEASKNFAYFLAKNVVGFEFGILTPSMIEDLPENVVERPIYTSSSFTFYQKVRLLWKLRRIRKEYNILHYIFTPTKLNSFLLKNFINFSGAKSVQTIATLREDLYSDKDLRQMIFADLVVTYSDYSKEKLTALGFPKVQRIYPGIDLEKYKYEPKNLRTLSHLEIEQGSFVFMYPGEYVRLGATDDIIQAFFKVSQTIPEAVLILACRLKKDPEALRKKEEVEKNLAELGISEKVFFVDIFSDMSKLYSISDVVLFPVQNMNGKFDVPLVIPEAFAMERPIIVSNLPILHEFAKEDNSVTIEKGNVEALSAAMVDLWQDEGKRLFLAKNGRRFAEENFDIKKVALEYKKIYENL